MTVHLIDFDRPKALYQLPIAGKLERIEHIKRIGTEFFKMSDFKRACKFYQKVNGYYNFGDVKNNVEEEDETSLAYIEASEKLDEIKTACFMNVVVCKAKQEQWQSVVDVTDQVIEFAPDNLKCWYWRGMGQYHV